MAKLAITALCLYVGLFVLGQQVIAKIRGSRNGGARPAARGNFGLMMASLIMINLSMFGMLFIFKPMVHQPVRLTPIAAGLAIAVAGLGLSWWAMWALGRNWVGGIGRHPDHELVKAGPYRLVRHPMYAGMLVSGIGLGIMGWNLFFALECLTFTGAFAIRAFGDERELRAEFKRKHRDYARTTGMFTPRLRKKRS